MTLINHATKRSIVWIWIILLFPISCVPSRNPDIPSSSSTTISQPTSIDLGTFGMGTAKDMAWSSDGKLLVVKSTAGGYIYDTSNWEILDTVPTQLLENGWFDQIIFFPDHRRLLFIAGYQKNFWQYDLVTKQLSPIYETIEDEALDPPIFSPDGNMLTFGSAICTMSKNEYTCRQTLNLYDADTGELIRRIPETGLDQWQDIDIYTFSPDSRIVATAGSDDVVRVWDVVNGTLLYTLPHESDVKSLSFSPDGSVLISAGLDASVRFWNLQDGSTLYILRGTLDAFHQYASLIDHNKKLLINEYDGRFIEYSLNDKFLPVAPLDFEMEIEERLKSQMGQYIPDTVIRIDPDGKRMAFLINGIIQIWDLQTGQRTYTLPEYVREIYAIEISPKRNLLAVADQNVHLWQIQPKQYIGTLEVNGNQIVDIAFDPNHSQMALALYGGRYVEIWDLTQSKKVSSHEVHCTGEDMSYSPNAKVAYSPDGSMLAFTGSCAVEILDARNGDLFKSFPNNLGTPAAVSFDANGKILIYVSGYGRQAWDLSTGRQLYSTKRLDEYQSNVALSPNLMISTDWDVPLYFFDPITGKRLYEFPQGEGSNTIALSSDGRLLAMDNYDRISLLDPTSGMEYFSLAFQPLPKTIVFSPDGNYLASGSYQNTVQLWDVSKTRQYASITPLQTATPNMGLTPTSQPTLTPGPTLAVVNPPPSEPSFPISRDFSTMHKIGELGMGRVNTIAWSSDGKWFAAGGYPGVYLFEAGSTQALKPLPATGELLMLQFSPDGLYLAGQITNDSIQIWDVQTGESLHQVKNIGCWNQGMEFSEDNQYLSANCGNIQYTWLVSNGILIDKHPLTLRNDPLIDHYSLQVGMKNVRLIDTNNGEIIKTFEIPGMAPSLAKFSPNGETLAVWHYQYEIGRTGVYYPGQDSKTILQLWNIFPDQPPTLRAELSTGTWHQGLMIIDSFQSLSFSPDSHWLATASGDDTTQVWDVKSGRLVNTLPNGNRILFAPDSRHLATLDHNSARIWTVGSKTPQLIWEMAGFNRWSYAMAFTSEGRELISATDEYFKFYTFNTPNLSAPIHQVHLPGIPGHNMAISPNGELLAYSTSDGIMIGNTNTEDFNWKMLYQFPEPLTFDRDLELTFSGDASLLASQDPDEIKRIRDLKTMKSIELEDPSSAPRIFVSTFQFSPDGSLLFGDDSKTYEPSQKYLWDTRTGKLVRQWTAPFYRYAFHPTQPVLVGADYSSGIIQFFDLQSGDLSKQIYIHPYIQKMTFSPDGRLLVLCYEESGNGSGKVEIRDTDTLALLKEIPGGASDILFSPDGNLLAITRGDGRIEYWGWR